MEPHDEMLRLRAAVERATGTTGAVSGFASHSGRESAWIHLGVGVVDTRLHGDRNAAIAELRAILRADADHAIADVLDTLAAEAERGPITAEMLRTMAAARRTR